MHILIGARQSFFHAEQHPSDLGGTDVEAFLTGLASERQVAPTKNQRDRQVGASNTKIAISLKCFSSCR
jgi:hypothetical protein